MFCAPITITVTLATCKSSWRCPRMKQVPRDRVEDGHSGGTDHGGTPTQTEAEPPT